MALIDKLMLLNFKEWLYEIRHPAVVNPEVKKWIDSADKLKQTVEKLKAILAKKKPEKKPEPKKVEIEKKPTKPEEKPVPKKPEPDEKEQVKVEPKDKLRPKDKVVKVEPKVKIEPKAEPKNVIKPTKLEKERLNDKKGSSRNGRQP